MATIAAIAALASAGAAAYGAHQQGQAATNASAMNAAAIEQQKRQQDIQNELVRRQSEGGIDARGNRTRYVPGVGFVQDSTPLTQALMLRSDQEELARLNQDMPRARMQREALFRQQQEERGLANALLARANIGTRSLADQEADATRLGVARAVSGPQQAGRDAVITALRQGTGAEAALAGAARGARDNTRVALEEARSGAPRAFADADSARTGDAMRNYSGLIAHALSQDGTEFKPNTAADTLLAAQLARERTQGTNLYYASNAVKPLQLQDDSRNEATRMASAISAFGNAAQLGWKAYQQWNQPAAVVDPYQTGRIPSTAQMVTPVPAHKGGEW